MRLTQITHHDLDGYGAATLVASYAEPARIVHVPRYGDVGPVVDDELKRLTKTKAAEMVLITDLGIEEPTIAFLRRFAAMNRKREPEAQHRLIVLDHHTSSIDQMRRQNLEPKLDADNPRLSRFDLGDPSVTVLIDENSSATKMVDTHRALFATRAPDAGQAEILALLVASVDALDLWRKEDPHFAGGFALDEIFWDNVGTLVPVGHPSHDPFVARLLIEATAKLRAGATPAELERAVPAIRGAIVDDLMRDAPDDDARLTTRQRMARALARSDSLFHALPDGTLLSFALDAGTFQRVSDLVMASGRAKRLVNVQRAGTLSFRSIDGTALDGARLFRGGGHQDAAGGKLPSGTAFSLSDAVAQVEPVLTPPKSAAANSPFAALKNWKG